jgi:hypothetical protein
MHIVKFILITLASYITAKNDKEPTNPILEINEKTYRQYTTTQPHFFLLFHNPWCKWSQNLENKLSKIHELLKIEKQPFYIGKIDTTINDIPKLIKEYIPAHLLNPTITYPRLVYYNNGIPMEVHSNRPSKDSLLTYMKRKIYPEAVRITNSYAMKDRVGQDSKAFVLLSSDKRAIEILHQVARDNKDYMFYYIEDDPSSDKIYENEFRLFSYGIEKEKMEIRDMFKDIEAFVRKNTFKNFYTKFNEELVNEIFMKQKTAIILFRNEYENKTIHLEEALPMLAQGERNITWIVTDLTGKYELKLAKLMSININALPTLRIIDFSTGIKRYELSRDLNIETVLNFIRSFRSGQLSPYYSSWKEDINENKKSPVKKLTSGTFYESVIFNKKNVLVFFHTQWCGHCKKVN